MIDASKRIGQRFGKLVIVRRVESKWKNSIRWECLCDCGRIIWRYSGSLYSGVTTHCGCNHKNKINSTKHGQRILLSRTYNSWRNLRSRCNYPKDKAYRWYGAKGISYDPRWDDYLIFVSDMGERPEGRTLDRIDSDGDYCKENCKWSTPKEQAANRKYRRN